MKKGGNWSFKKHVILSSGITLAVMLLRNFFSNEAASIGIIGGSDGPTAIFLAGNPVSTFLIPNVVLFTILLVLYKPFKKLIQR